MPKDRDDPTTATQISSTPNKIEVTLHKTHLKAEEIILTEVEDTDHAGVTLLIHKTIAPLASCVRK